MERRSRDRPRQSTSFVPVPASFVPRAASLLTHQCVRPRAATFPYISWAERESGTGANYRRRCVVCCTVYTIRTGAKAALPVAVAFEIFFFAVHVFRSGLALRKLALGAD